MIAYIYEHAGFILFNGYYFYDLGHDARADDNNCAGSCLQENGRGQKILRELRSTRHKQYFSPERSRNGNRKACCENSDQKNPRSVLVKLQGLREMLE